MKWTPFSLKSEGEKQEPTPEHTATSSDVATPDIRTLTGHPSMESVKQAAITSEAAPPPKTQRSRREAKAQIDAKELAEQAAALEVIGKVSMKKLATAPYQVWAMFASDPALKLTPDEATELANAYFLLAKALKPNMNKPSWMLLAIVLLNAEMIGTRLQRKLEESQQKQVLLEATEGKAPN